MVRFVVLLLLFVAGALVVALFFDHRGRRDARVDRLRHAFLHGAPLAGTSRPAALTEVVHPGGLRFRAPASWTVDIVDDARVATPAAPPAGSRRIAVEVVTLEGAASPADVLKSLVVDGERAVHVLANGHALMKSVETVEGPGGLVASYTWRLGRAADGGRLQLAVFRLPLPVEGAADVIAQADLGTLDREVRDATFADGTAADA
jgi:hypothetical protein